MPIFSPNLYVFTHDSFYLGEDGPTHQPEHISSLRLIPNSIDLRPAEANETKLCLDAFFKQSQSPAFLFLTRQGLPTLDMDKYPHMRQGVPRGAYVLRDPVDEPDIIILASGSELSLALDAIELLPEFIRISMPSMSLFERQDQAKTQCCCPKFHAG